MKREELLLLLKESGFYGPGGATMDRFNGSIENAETLVRQAMIIQREACAKVCDARYMGDNTREDMEAKRCAAAIRASHIS